VQASGGDVELQPGHGLTHGVEFDAYMTEFSGTDATVGAIANLSLAASSELQLSCTVVVRFVYNLQEDLVVLGFLHRETSNSSWIC
jgi:hypothetical protein